MHHLEKYQNATRNLTELAKVIIKNKKKNAFSGLSGCSIFHADQTSTMTAFEKSAQIIFRRKIKNLRNQRNIIRIKIINGNPITYSIVAIKSEENTALMI